MMTPFEVLVFAVSLGSTLGLFLYFLLRSCIEQLELYEHKVWIILIYIIPPLFGLDLVLALYYGIISVALTLVVGCIIAILVAALTGLGVYLSLVAVCPCLPSSQQNVMALVSGFIIAPLSAVGVIVLIKPHIPDTPQQLSTETGGAAILGGLMVFSGVGALAYLVDMYYKHKKEKREVKTRAPPKSMFEEWKKEIENQGFQIVPPGSYTEVPSSDRGVSFATESIDEGKRSAAPSLADSHIRQDGEKKITLTVEDPSMGTVYNFTLYVAAQQYQGGGGYEAFKLTGVRRCLSYNPDIFDLEFRRPNGRPISTNYNFYNELDDDECFLATAKAAPPPMLRRAGGFVDGGLDQP